ncbi:hypothetical protein ACPA54_21970 [Uniformispora flossi]|uniref:hypothetical protein n=1 Tax=Uniformispora flossi TaxID=3390723 RepID=UPI003C2E4B13
MPSPFDGDDLVRHLPHRFAGFIGNVPQTDFLREGRGNHTAYMRTGSRRDRRAGHAQSGGIWEAAPAGYRKPIRLVPGVNDFRVPPEGVMRTAAAVEDARMRWLGPFADKLKDGPRSSLYVIANAGGHFPGVGSQAVISTVVGEVAGCHPLRTAVNTTGPRVPPDVAVVPNATAPLQAAELRRPAVALAALRSGLATSGLAAVSLLVRAAVPRRRAETRRPPTDRQAARGPDRRIKEVERLLRR